MFHHLNILPSAYLHECLMKILVKWLLNSLHSILFQISSTSMGRIRRLLSFSPPPIQTLYEAFRILWFPQVFFCLYWLTVFNYLYLFLLLSPDLLLMFPGFQSWTSSLSMSFNLLIVSSSLTALKSIYPLWIENSHSIPWPCARMSDSYLSNYWISYPSLIHHFQN